jgi:hypothetical protein
MRGDVVIDGGIIDCVVETVEDGAIREAVVVNGVLVTPDHPIEVNGKWVFPLNLQHYLLIGMPDVRNFSSTGHRDKG